jgi:hypothetical protein
VILKKEKHENPKSKPSKIISANELEEIKILSESYDHLLTRDENQEFDEI